MPASLTSFIPHSAPPSEASEESESATWSSAPVHDPLDRLPPAAKMACLRQAARRLSPALLHVVHQSTTKSRDRAMAALIVLIYGPTPFGGANNVKDVAIRYGMTEQNLHQLVGTLRRLLQSEPDEESDE